jgi:chaperonin GroEL
LYNLKGSNEDETVGIDFIRKAIEAPMRQIVENAGLDGAVIVNKVRSKTADYGFNARTGKYEFLFEAGVIDPAKVSRTAIENAASIASMLLTTEVVIADIKEDAPAGPPMPPMGGMGGMGGMM